MAEASHQQFASDKMSRFSSLRLLVFADKRGLIVVWTLRNICLNAAGDEDAPAPSLLRILEIPKS